MTKLSAVLSICALSLIPSIASAQRFGAHVNWANDFELGVGARYEHSLTNTFSQNPPMSNAFFIGQFDYYLDPCDPGDCTIFELNPGIAVPLNATNLRPYLGAGLNIARISVDMGSFGTASNTEVGLNLLGGLKFGLGGMQAYSEARLSLGGGEQFALSFGLLFGGN